MLQNGMYFYLNGRLFNCYGLGVIKYDRRILYIVGYKNIDMCIKSIELDDKTIVATDTRDMELEANVVVSTYSSLLIISSLIFIIVGRYKMIK